MKRLVYESNSSMYFNAVKDVQQLDGDMQRFLYFSNRVLDKNRPGLKDFTYLKLYWNDEGELVYVRTKYKVMLSSGNKVFLLNSLQDGFKFTPSKGMTFWKGLKFASLDTPIKEAVFKELDCEWVLEGEDHAYGRRYYYDYFLKSNAIVNRVLRKRITNPLDLVKAFLSNDVRWRGLKLRSQAGLVLKLAKDENNYMHYAFDLLKVEENPTRLLHFIVNQGIQACQFATYRFADALRWELVKLDKKVNCNWSHKRLDEVHTQCSRDLRKIELSMMDPVLYPYSAPCPMLDGMELIDNNMRLWEEGSVMNHCIYNYLENAKQRKLFHFHCTFGGDDFSLAVQTSRRWSDEHNEYLKEFDVQQMYQAHNRSCTDEQKDAINAWLGRDDVQAWFANEVKVHEEAIIHKQKLMTEQRMQEAHDRIVVPRIVDDMDELPF